MLSAHFAKDRYSAYTVVYTRQPMGAHRVCFVYIMASSSGTLYVGVTNSAYFRSLDHKSGRNPGSFTSRYKVDRLVYFETFEYVNNAIAREKEIKGWRRSRKIELIESKEPIMARFEQRFWTTVQARQRSR
jgi:putative endonuclease